MEAGFGRGSAEMGVPTANLPPGPLEETLQDLHIGVYFGCVYLPDVGSLVLPMPCSMAIISREGIYVCT